MKTIITAIITLLIAGVFSGCGNKSVNISPKATHSTIKSVPDWYNNHIDFIPNGYIGVKANDTSRDMMISEEKAQNAARGRLRLQIKDIGKTGDDRWNQETGLGAESDLTKRFMGGNQSASAHALRGSRLIKSETRIEKEGVYRTYVIMIAPDPALELLRQLEKDKELMDKFEETNYFKDLSKQLDKYELKNK